MNAKKKKCLEALWYFAVFAFFFLWFTRIHPLIIFDGDDWTYIAYTRRAIPIWGAWNPAKVFPEVLMPFFSNIILHTLVPLTGDYITGFTLGHALVVSGFITVYAWCLVTIVRRSFSLSRLNSLLVGTLFLVFHFLVFRSKEYGNGYLFHCLDLNCYYNYLLPAIANCCLLMVMMDRSRFEAFLSKANATYTGLFYLALYFTIFSNLVDSGILAAYAGSCLLLSLLKQIKKFQLKSYVKENTVWLVTLLMWLVSAIYELSGGRASEVSGFSPLKQLRSSIYCLKDAISTCSPVFWACSFTIILLAAVQFLLTRQKGEDEKTLFHHFLTLLVGGAALSVYTVMLCSTTWAGHLYRSEYLFPLFFYGFLLVFLALGYLLKKQSAAAFLLPFLLVVLISDINTSGHTFLNSHPTDYPTATCADISRDIVNQYLEADAAGLYETTIYVPMHVLNPETEDNWPHSLFLMPRIGSALYEQGILSRPISATFVADASVNERFHIPIPTE